jgi:hypothetical protein
VRDQLGLIEHRLWPTISSKVRKPMDAMISRTSSATKKK